MTTSVLDGATPEHWRMVEENTGLVWFFIHQFRIQEQRRDDAFQDGCLGLLRAAMKFERHQTHGDMPILRSTKGVPLSERLWARVTKTESCWLWDGYTTPDGYGRIAGPRVGGKPRTLAPHRVAYELLVGPIPEGLEIDHLCQVRHCVNPAHMEPVTHNENVRRATERLTYCPSGHEYDEENTHRRADGARVCRACDRVNGRSDRRKGKRGRQRIA